MKRFKRLILVMAAVCLVIVSYADSYLKAESSDAIYTNHWPAFTISYPDHWIEGKLAIVRS